MNSKYDNQIITWSPTVINNSLWDNRDVKQVSIPGKYAAFSSVREGVKSIQRNIQEAGNFKKSTDRVQPQMKQAE